MHGCIYARALFIMPVLYLLCIDMHIYNTLFNSIFAGVQDFAREFPSVAVSISIVVKKSVIQCKKYLGERKKIQLWSRGHVFLVRPCGHIEFWRTIYR